MKTKLIALLALSMSSVCSAYTEEDMGRIMINTLKCKVYGEYSSEPALPYIHEENFNSIIDLIASNMSLKKSIKFRSDMSESVKHDELVMIKDINKGVRLDDVDCVETSYEAKRFVKVMGSK